MDKSEFNLKTQFIGSIEDKFQAVIGKDLSFIAKRDWPGFFQGLADLERFITPEDFRLAGRHLIATYPPLRNIIINAQANSSLSDQYINVFGTSGLLSVAMPVKANASQQPRRKILIAIQLAEGMPPCQPFFEVIAGQLEQLASLMGYPIAHVAAAIDSTHARYQVSVEPRSILAECKARFSRLATPRHTAQLLQTMTEEHLRLIRHTLTYQLSPPSTVSKKQGVKPMPQNADVFLDGIVIVDNDLLIADANAAFCLTTGYSKESIVGMPIRNVIPSLPSVDNGNGYSSVSAFCRDKTLRPLTAYRSDVDPDGFSTYIVRDLLEETQAQWKQNRLSTQLRAVQKLDGIGRLSSGIVHDFNNLLFAIQANAELAIADPNLCQQALDDIVSATKRGAGITNRLLHYSRPTSDVDYRLDINDLVLETSRLTQAILPENVVIETSLPEHPVFVNAAEHQLEQVLINLLVNARDAMPTGGTCHISIQELEEVVQLNVSDTGIGMDEETRRRIFEPLFTTKAKDKGTGLGLSIVTDIIESLDGDINVDSVQGEGSRFTLSLPRAYSANPKVERTAPKAAGKTKGDSQSPMKGKILVVEDNEQVLTLISLMLKGAGFDVITATDGKMAIDQLTSDSSVDLVLLDVVLPVMGGRETSERVANISPQTAVLFTSAYAANSPQLAFIHERSLPFIAKPFSTEDIRTKVASMMQSQTRELHAS